MKFTLLCLLISGLSFLTADAQPPQRMSYQAVIRNASNVLMANTPIGMRVSILQGSDSGTEVYKEVFSPNPVTNANGLVTVEIGGGTPVTGTFAGINWANGPFFVKIETDPSGGTNYTITSTSQLLSVPYALYSGTAFNSSGKRTIILSDTISDAQAQAKIAAEFGTNTEAIRIVGCSRLTNVDLSMVTNAIEIIITDNPKLQTVNLSNLKNCIGELVIYKCPSLTTLKFSNLYSITGGFKKEIHIENNEKLGNLSFPSLKIFNGSLFIRDNSGLIEITMPLLESAPFGILSISGNKKLSTIHLPILKYLAFINISQNATNTITFPSLTSIGSFRINDEKNLSTLSMSSLSLLGDSSIIQDGYFDFGYTSVSGNPNLTSITLGPLSKLGFNKNLNFGNNKLSSTQVNTLLNKLVTITPSFSGVSIFLNGQTPPAPPTGQGIIDRNTLISRGNSVTID